MLRLITGVLLIVASIAHLITMSGFGATAAAQTAGYVVALAAFYVALHRGLGERVLARVDPFVATAIVLLPLLVVNLSVFPDVLHVAVGIYIGGSLLISAAIRYGGCEVVSLPTLLFGRRYVVYCSLNIVDAAERPLRRSSDIALRASAIAALVVATYYLIVSPLLVRLDVDNPISHRWALLLLAPAVLLGYRAWQSRRGDRDRVFGLALGAGAMVAGALILGGLAKKDLVFGAVVVTGLLLAGYRAIARSRATRGGERPHGEDVAFPH